METLFGMFHFNDSDTTMILRRKLWFIVYPATHKKCFLQESWKNYRAGCASTRLDLRSGNKDGQAIIRRQPDAIFKHCDLPGIIEEVLYSQRTKAMPHLVDDYILEANGSVRLVVGLDIDYETKKGTILMWRPGYVENERGQVEL